MLKLTSILLLLLFFILPISNSINGPHITDVNILLPPLLTYPVEYRLQGTDGCFQWSWDHHDILSLQPEYNASSRCSTSARLKSIAPYDGRKETAIFAADVRTGIVIRCKVFVDEISRVQIFHSSVKLDLDGLATLRVRGFDRQDNVFSSLVGVQFKWELKYEENGMSHNRHRLVHVPLKESPLSDCGGGFCGDLDIQIKLEDSGVYSDLFAVKGVEIGHEIVSVNLVEPEYENMGDRIVLTVAEAMSIEPPSPLYVIIGAVVQYSLKVIRENTPQAIPLPSPHHRWSVMNSSIAQVDSRTGAARALNLGITTIIAEDTRVADHMQISSLHVVIPDSICLYKLPLTASGDPIEGTSSTLSTGRWYVVVGRQYVVHMKVFSGGIDGHEIHITEGNAVKLQYNESDCWVTSLVPDRLVAKYHYQSSAILKPISHGLGRLTASLIYRGERPETIEVLKTVQEVRVCDQVKIDIISDSSKTIHLPWVSGIYQELSLKATGGCEETLTGYKWYSSDMAVVSVSASGIIQAKKPGHVSIKVVSAYDATNYDQVDVKVSIPSQMVMLQHFPVETVVGTYLQAAVTLRASDGSHFYSCDSFRSMVKWNSGSESFKIIDTTSEAETLIKQLDDEGFKLIDGPPCAWTYIYASSAGRSLLHATLQTQAHLLNLPVDASNLLKASSPIAAYNPLVVKQIGDGNHFGGYSVDRPSEGVGHNMKILNELYLVPRTKSEILLVGGPEQWGQGVKFVETVDILDEEQLNDDLVLAVEEPTTKGRLYRVSCVALGIFRLVFSRGNLVGDDHPLAAIEKVELSLICAFPASITLIANEPVNALNLIQSASRADRTPERTRVTPVTVANGGIVRIAAVGIHKSGKVFTNCSSLGLKWELSSCNGLAYWDANDIERSRASWERFLVLKNTSGMCTVRATVIGLSDIMIDKASVLLEMSENVLTDAIRLQIVSSLRIVPEFILVYYSPDAKVNLSITGGTCFLDTIVNDTRVVEVVQPLASSECMHLTFTPRGLGTALITVNDIGLAPPLAASAVVRVADIDWIKIISQEEINLMDGSEKVLDIVAGVHDGSVFDSSQLAYMDVHVHIEDPVVELVHMHVSGLGVKDPSVPNFVIRARSLGVTTLFVSAKKQSGQEILSQPVRIEVYAPPRIHPDDIFLVPGASYVLTLKGGPTVGVFVEYASMDDGTATVHKSVGRISAISPGNTTLRAIVYGSGDTVICEAEGKVRVGIPSSMVLSMQSEQLSVGREMPLFPSLAEGNLFSFYELCKNFKWTIEDEEVLRFQSDMFPHSDEADVQNYSEERDVEFINVVHGRSAGRTNVAVSLSCNFMSMGFSHSRSYNASASLLVVSELPLALGLPITWVLPPFYTSSSLLPGSSEPFSQWESYNKKGTIVYSLLKTCAKKSEGVQHDPISVHGDRIRTLESDNLACIHAKDWKTGRTEIASCVRVAEVTQIRASTKKSHLHMVDLAVGAEHELILDYFDSLGNPFHEALNAVQYDVETNYPDVVSINMTYDGRGNILLKALRHGRALIRMSMNTTPPKSDYLMISVGAHMYPQNPALDLGSHLNFRIEGMDGPVLGRWLSTNTSVISIDATSGTAHAVGEGATEVVFEGPNFRVQTTASVRTVDLLLVNSPADTLTNIPFPTKGYQFSVRFSSDKFKFTGINEEVLFDCTVDPPFVGYTKPWRDLNTGNLYCLFFPYSPEYLANTMPKLKAARPDVSMSINASLRDVEHVTGSSTADFVGGFSIINLSKDLMLVNLTSERNKSVISIVGNTDVEVHWKDRDLMLVSPIHKYDRGIGGQAEYEVQALSTMRFKDKIVFTLPATGQRVEVDVNYEPDTVPSSDSQAQPALWVAFFSVVALLITIWVLVKWFSYTGPVVTQPILASSTVEPVTPNRSPDHIMQHSPRTPQPYMDYVRRTIDETPYYKRDGPRRRVNPQHTF